MIESMFEIAIWILDASWCAMKAGVELLYKWQTLVSALIASATAFFSLRPTVQQYNEQRKIEIQRARSRTNQARAMIADNLAALSDYTELVHDVLKDPSQNSPPNAPDHSMKELRNLMIDLDEFASERVMELSHEYQTHNARLGSFLFNRSKNKRAIIGAELKDCLYDLAVLRATSDSLFAYARKRSNEGPKKALTSEKIKNGLSQAARGYPHYDPEDEYYSGVIELINKRYPAEGDK